jgi:nucleoside-diphosphate-sugar epimerase
VHETVLAGQAEEVSGRLYNVACGKRITVNMLVDELRSLTGRDLTPRYEPERAGEVRDSVADLTRARSELGYEPSVSFSEGLRLALRAHEDEPLANDVFLRAG